MPAFTQKYVIVQLLEAIPEGAEFSSDNWPLHTTIVSTFAIDWDVPTLSQHLEHLLASRVEMATVARGEEHFGPNGEVHVTLLTKTPELASLHTDILDMLEDGNVVLNDPQYARDGFRPHVTIQQHARIREGEAVRIRALSIIDMFPGGDAYQRKVLKTIKLASNTLDDIDISKYTVTVLGREIIDYDKIKADHPELYRHILEREQENDRISSEETEWLLSLNDKKDTDK